MKINCLQKKPFYIFEIESFLNDDEYDLIERNFPLEDKKQMLNAIGNKTYFDNQIKGCINQHTFIFIAVLCVHTEP